MTPSIRAKEIEFSDDCVRREIRKAARPGYSATDDFESIMLDFDMLGDGDYSLPAVRQKLRNAASAVARANRIARVSARIATRYAKPKKVALK